MSDRIPPITNEELNRILGIEQIQDLELTDPSYTQNLNAYLHVLQDNIERVLSVPFLQGQRGESILAAQFRLFEDDGSPKEIGKEVLKALFPLTFNNTEPGSDWKTAVDLTPEYATINDVHAYDNLENTATVDLYYTLISQYEEDTDTNRRPLQSASYFVFYDARLAEISEGNDSIQYFEDTSAAIFRQHISEDSYSFVNTNALPTIYYQDGHYYWKVNGIHTGISCEGLQGEAGKDGTLNIVKITASTETANHIYNVEEVFVNNETAWVTDLDSSLIDETAAIGIIMNDNASADDIYFGIIYKEVQNNQNIWKFKTDDILSIKSLVGEITAKEIFDSLGNDILGMYVKDKDFDNNHSCHVLYSDTPNTFSIAPMDYNEVIGNIGELSENIYNFNIKDYNALNIDVGALFYNGNGIFVNSNTVNMSLNGVNGSLEANLQYTFTGKNYTKSLSITTDGVIMSSACSSSSTDWRYTIFTGEYGHIGIPGAHILSGGFWNGRGIHVYYDTIDIDMPTTLNNTLTVSGATTLNNTLTVSGITNITYNYNNGQNLILTKQCNNINGNGSEIGTLEIINRITTQGEYVDRNIIYGLKITNDSDSLNKYGIYCEGNSEFYGNTIFYGNTTFGGNMTISGITTLGGDIKYNNNNLYIKKSNDTNNININDDNITILQLATFARTGQSSYPSDGYISFSKPIYDPCKINELAVKYNNQWYRVKIENKHLIIEDNPIS